jgi:carboxypeptidase C (cathepsin A)
MADTQPETPAPEAPRSFTTTHRGIFHGTALEYRCIAGETHVPGPDGKPQVSLFSFAYLADAPDPASRPVTFIFNGGPGSASLWLHMGAFGPRRLVVPSDATHSGNAPYTVEDNPRCNLDQSDLVFIDPPGTGFSRMLPPAKPEEGWGLDADAKIIAQFIKTWLTANARWASPRFIMGESYGTTRAVAVAGKLAGGLAGVGFNGLALISAVLDFHTVRFERGNPLPDVCFLPTYAATALHYGLAEAPDGRDAFLDEVRAFAVEEYLPALVAGSRLAASRRARVLRRLARVTGLNETWLERTRLRIDPARFRKELLREQGLSVGRLDSRYTGRDYDEAGEAPDDDASSYAIDAAYVTAMNDHLTRVLGIDWGKPYTAFNREAMTKWDWHGPRKDDTPRWPGYVNVAPTLGRLLRENAGLRVLVANGIFDLATPFYAVETTIAGNGIDAARVKMTYYDAGHMMYLHEPSLGALVADLRRWID